MNNGKNFEDSSVSELKEDIKKLSDMKAGIRKIDTSTIIGAEIASKFHKDIDDLVNLINDILNKKFNLKI